MDKKSIVEKLIENTPLAVIIIGLSIFLLGAAGGWGKLQIQINDLGGRISLAIMGSIVSLVGVVLIWREKTRDQSVEDLKDYGIKITSPQDGAEVGPRIEVFGTYEIRPPDNAVRILESSHSPRSHQYWPKRLATFNPKQKTWSAVTHLGGEPNEKKVIVVAVVGESGRALFDYFDKVGQKTDNWIGISVLPHDVQECDRVIVKRV